MSAVWYVFVVVALLYAAPCLCAIETPPQSQSLVAAYLTASAREDCRHHFDTTGNLLPYDESARKFECDNMPIEYNPQPPEKYAANYGSHMDLLVLGYVHDRHAQAFLVHVDVGEPGNPDLLSKFNDPYVAVSNAGSPKYNSQYSNVLWNRFEAANVIYCFRDKYGKPYEFTVPDNQESWLTVLPAYDSNTTKLHYHGTHAFVRHFSTYEDSPLFDSVICSDAKWNRTTLTCQV